MKDNSTNAVSVPLPWHTQTWNELYDQLVVEQLPHALLISGIQHTGKVRFALALARLLLCEAPQAGHNCGECHACQLSAVGNHGDVRWVAPEGSSRAIKIAQIRDVVDFCTKTSSFGKRKVVVFSPAEAMNISAANALLKSLEEPAADTYMLLVSHRLQAIPATVRSRCQKIQLPLPSAELGVKWMNQLTGNESSSKKLLALADNRPMLAARYYDAEDIEVTMAIEPALEAFRTGRASVPAVSTILRKIPIEEALAMVGSWLQAVIRRECQTAEQQSQVRAYFVGLDEVKRLTRVLQSGSNPNPELLLEGLLVTINRELGA